MNYRLKFRIPFTYEFEPEENQDCLCGDSLPSYKKTILIYVDSVSFDGTALIDQGRFEEQVDNAKNLTVYEKGVLKEAAYDWCLEDFEIVCINFSRLPEQCTGLEDKNGKLIYKGDVLCTTDHAVGIVTFGNYGGNDWEGWHYGYYINWLFQKGCGERKPTLRKDIWFWNEHKEIEVIGNIHENPELLEGYQNEEE